jgi:WD40 repeat protein
VPIDHFYLVDLTTGRIVSRGPAGVQNAVYADYSPDGRHVTVAGRNGEVVVLHLPSGRPAGPRVDAYSGDSFSVRYDATGARVTTASTTGQAALLDGRSGALLATAALPPTEGVTVSNFAPDGTIVLATFSGHVFRWDPTPAHAVSFACSVTGGGLSRQQWHALAPQQPWRDSCPG